MVTPKLLEIRKSRRFKVEKSACFGCNEMAALSDVQKPQRDEFEKISLIHLTFGAAYKALYSIFFIDAFFFLLFDSASSA